MTVSTIRDFEAVCMKVKADLSLANPVEFIAGKFENPINYKDNYMWIATADNEIGFAQCHYEIRLCEDGFEEESMSPFISVEVHVESKKACIYTGLDKGINVLPLVPKCQGTNYIWRSYGKKFSVDVSQVPSIINELRNLEKAVGKSLRNCIKTTLG